LIQSNTHNVQKKLSLLILLLATIHGRAQSLKIYPEMEGYFGTNYYFLTEETPKAYKQRGFSHVAGLRTYIHVNRYLAFCTGLGIRNHHFSSTYKNWTFQLMTMVKFLHLPDADLTFFAEYGIEYRNVENDQFPFYLGVDQNIGQGSYFTFKTKIPTLIDKNVAEINSRIEFGFELGWKYHIGFTKPAAKIEGHGNPFILQ